MELWYVFETIVILGLQNKGAKVKLSLVTALSQVVE